MFIHKWGYEEAHKRTEVWNGNFKDDAVLESVIVEELPGNTWIANNGTFQNCGNLKEFKIPTKLKGISVSPFAGCPYLEKNLDFSYVGNHSITLFV